MACGVSIEIECQDEENTFHTTYKVQKYPEYARKLEHSIRSHFSSEGIRHDIRLNANPPRGYVPYQNVRNWYVKPREPDSKVRYPRLGSFEVLLRTPSGFAGRVPEQLWVWSKLQTLRWPDPDRLASDLLRLLVSGQQDEDVSDLVQKLRNSCLPPHQVAEARHELSSSTKAIVRKPSNPPMFFSLSPRQRVPTPVEIRSPPERHRDVRSKAELPPRPMSALSPSRAPPAPPQRQRPASAGNICSSSNTGQWINGGSTLQRSDSPASSVGHASAPASPNNRHMQEASLPVQASWGDDEDPFETEPPASTPPTAWAATTPAQVVTQPAASMAEVVTQPLASMPQNAWASTPPSTNAEPQTQMAAQLQQQVVTQPVPPQVAALPMAEPSAQMAEQLQQQVVTQPLAQVAVQPQPPVVAQPWAHVAEPAAQPPLQPPTQAVEEPAHQASRPQELLMEPAAATQAPAASKLGDYDDYADDFEDDAGSPAAARTPTTHAGDNTVLTLTETSALSAEPSQAVVTQPAAALASAAPEPVMQSAASLASAPSMASQPPSDPVPVEEVEESPWASAVASAAASASQATAREEAASRRDLAEEVEEYEDEGFEDEGFEDEDPPSPSHLSPQPPMKSDGTASTATRGSNADAAEVEDPDLEDVYEEGFEGDDDVEEDVEEDVVLSSHLTGKDRIVVEGQSYDYAEDNEFDDEVSDMSREVSIDDANSVKSVDD